MRILWFLAILSGASALFGFGGSKTTTTTTNAPKMSLGAEIHIPRSDEDDSTGEIVIPFNEPSTTRRTTSKPTTTIPVLTVGGIGLERKTTVDVRSFTTSTMNPKFTAATKRLPSSDRDTSSGCPNRIDAYTFGPDNDFAFYEHTVYLIKNDRIFETSSLEHEFPNGPRRVNGALYDPEREILWLIEERSVFGFKRIGGDWTLQSVFPKELPSSVPFTPDSAIRWHNKHQVLLSNGGKFALYDEYWNKSLLSGRTEQYFENLPDRVRGVSVWKNDVTAHIFTQSLVFEYDAEKKRVVADGVALGDFWRC